MAVRIQVRRDTAANWVANNPSLREGEMGIEIDTLKIKIGPTPATGDATPWNSITAYANLVPSDFNSVINGYIETTDIGAQGGVVGLNSSYNAIIPGSSIIIEGPTADSYETTLTVTDPTADRTITLPNATGTVALTTDITTAIDAITTDVIEEGSTNKYFSDERAQDAVATALAAGTHTNLTVTYNDTSNSISLAAAPGYVDEQAVDAVATALAAGTHTNISVSYNDAGNAISLTGAVTYTDENAQDAVGNAVGTGLSYNDTTGAISVDTTAIQARVADVSDTEIGYLNGITSAIQTQLDDKTTASSTTTFTNKSISLATNTVTSTLAELNTAISDADVATLAGTETLSNKTLTTPTINGPTITATGQTPTIHGIYLPAPHNIIFEGTTADDFETTLEAGEPTGDRTITLPDASGTVALVANVAALSGATFTGAVSGTDLTLSGNLTVNGTTTNLNSTNLVVEDKNIVLGDTATPTDITADGGGITLKGTTDKTLNWVDATDAWTSSEHINLASGKTLKYNGTDLVASQSGNSGKYLTTDGTSTSWGTVSGYSAPTLGSTSIASGATVTTIAGLTLTSPTITGTPTISGSGDFLINATTNIRIIPGAGSSAYVGTAAADNIIVTAGGTQTLTNKTLTSPVISTITNTGTLTLPTTTGTLALVSQLVASAAPGTEGKLYGYSNSTAASKTTLGYQAGNASSSNIVAVGYQAGLLSTAANNVAIGHLAFAAGTTGNNNVAIGFESLKTVTTTYDHVAVGYRALAANLNVAGNTAVGSYAGQANISGDITAVGSSALTANTTGTGNIAIGSNSLAANTTNSNSTAVGHFALRLSTGSFNSALGMNAGYAITTGGGNTIFGAQAGNGATALTTGSGNIIIGYLANASSATVSNEITLGSSNMTTLRIPGLSISATTTALTVPSLTPTNAIAAIYGGTGFSTYATGDIIYSSATDTLAKLAAGTNGQILTLASGVPSWAAAPAGFSAPTIGSTSIASGATVTSISGLVLKDSSSTTITANTATTIDTNALSAFTTAKYVISIKQGSKVRSSEVIVQTDGTSVDMTEFGITETGGAISGIVVSASVSSTNCVLQVTITDAATTNATVKINEVLI